MKNVHLISTDKPSRLYLDANKEFQTRVAIISNRNVINQNIYITSDEEIKTGDWYLNNGNLLKCNEVKKRSSCKKIILTDNKDLIKDGVQEIDGEFLEWFVKNTSCEEVEVDVENYTEDEWIDDDFGGEIYTFGYERYKIILPEQKPKQTDEKGKTMTYWGGLEEPKQREMFLMNANEIIDTRKPKEETTLEEVLKFPLIIENGLEYLKLSRKIFEAGIRYQQEQDKNKYSEEEVLEQLNLLYSMKNSLVDTFTDENDYITMKWFEKHKKK